MSTEPLTERVAMAIGYAMARVEPPVHGSDGIPETAARLAPLVIESGYLDAERSRSLPASGEAQLRAAAEHVVTLFVEQDEDEEYLSPEFAPAVAKLADVLRLSPAPRDERLEALRAGIERLYRHAADQRGGIPSKVWEDIMALRAEPAVQVVTEAPCPMCGRDCSHGRLSPADLTPTNAAPFNYRAAHQTASRALDAHHERDNARAVVEAMERDEAICPVCRALLGDADTPPASEPPLDVDRLTGFLVASAVYEGAHGNWPTIRAQAEWMVSEWNDPRSLTNLTLTQPLPDTPMHRAVRRLVQDAIDHTEDESRE